MESRKKTHFKPELTIAKIGKIRFWTGIGLGILNAVIFYLFTFYLLDFMSVMSVLLDGDLPSIPTEVSFFKAPFLIATSLTVGISMMIRHWFMQATFHFQRSRKKVTLRLSNFSLFLFYLVFYVAAIFIRFSYFDKASGETNQLIDYNSLFFSIPLYLFFAAWTEVSRYFKTGNWIPYSFFISLFTVIVLNFITIQPSSFVEIAFQNYHAEEITYVDTEVEKAKRDYDISFSEETIKTLKELRTENALNQLEKTRLAFQTDGKVSLDTIILEKILIHNFKGYYKDIRQSYQYIFPFQAYEQLKKVDPNSHEARELLNILSEFYKLSMFRNNIHNDNNKSVTYHNKANVLINYIHDYYRKFNYARMYDQIVLIAYSIQKSATYNHPFSNTEIPLPRPPIFDPWIYDKFPELEYKPK